MVVQIKSGKRENGKWFWDNLYRKRSTVYIIDFGGGGQLWKKTTSAEDIPKLYTVGSTTKENLGIIYTFKKCAPP